MNNIDTILTNITNTANTITLGKRHKQYVADKHYQLLRELSQAINSELLSTGKLVDNTIEAVLERQQLDIYPPTVSQYTFVPEPDNT